jgi:hypothetical protein
MLFTVKNINLLDFVHIVNEDQPIAYITGSIDLSIELILERDKSYLVIIILLGMRREHKYENSNFFCCCCLN